MPRPLSEPHPDPVLDAREARCAFWENIVAALMCVASALYTFMAGRSGFSRPVEILCALAWGLMAALLAMRAWHISRTYHAEAKRQHESFQV